ncbi:MAG TPA: hypothetical protein VNN25_23660, partial [Thermoanaerobaculia bacterium]|nr:hypothetical protein [Thermoanaerobaculia bacterium]
RSRRAIDRTFHLINSSLQVIEASERFAAEGPVRASRQLRRVGFWLSDAAGKLDRARAGLRDVLDRAEQFPKVALDAPEKVIEASLCWVVAYEQLAAISSRFEDTLTWLADSVESGAIAIPIEEQAADAGKAVIVLRRSGAPCIPPDLLARESNRIPFRRQRSICLTVAEAVRRIVRGRAPPSSQTARTDHSS